MNVYKHVMLGLEKAIEHEIQDIFQRICQSGNPYGTETQARYRIQMVRRAAVNLREIIDEEVRNADAESGAAEGHVRGSLRQGQYRYSPQGSEGVRRSGQTWEASEIRPQITRQEAVDQSKLDYKGPDGSKGEKP